MFADNIVLIDDMQERVNRKLEFWRSTLESMGFKLSRTKTEYLHYKFSEGQTGDREWVSLDGVVLPQSDHYKYLDSIFKVDGGCEEDCSTPHSSTA